MKFQTLFGNLELRSPRWNHCGCQPNPAKTFSPLSELLKEHVSPERLYLETKWASLISFELTAHLLKDALPTRCKWLRTPAALTVSRLEETFRGWYPDFRPAENEAQEAA